MMNPFGSRPHVPAFALVTCVLIGTAVSALGASSDDRTALDRYVASPDPSYRYEVISTAPGDGVTVSVLRLTSQTWLTEKEVDHPVWQHWLTVIRPAKVGSAK